LEDVITEIDLVLIMSVNPGFGGQKFIPQALNKISKLKAMITASGSNALIEVDGGVTLENAAALVAAGADALVAGNTVFSSPDPADTIKKLKQVGK
jgi:ribulose-phosphate 3-epimerase